MATVPHSTAVVELKEGSMVFDKWMRRRVRRVNHLDNWRNLREAC